MIVMIKLPIIISYLDYHEAKMVQEILADFDIYLKYKEIPSIHGLDGMYHFLWYKDKMPTATTIEKLVQKQFGR